MVKTKRRAECSTLWIAYGLAALKVLSLNVRDACMKINFCYNYYYELTLTSCEFTQIQLFPIFGQYLKPKGYKL